MVRCGDPPRRGDKYVTVIIDVRSVRDGTGPARLLDMVEGRSKRVFQQREGGEERPGNALSKSPQAAIRSRDGATTAHHRAVNRPTNASAATPRGRE